MKRRGCSAEVLRHYASFLNDALDEACLTVLELHQVIVALGH